MTNNFGKSKIVAVRKEKGDISEVLLDDGTNMSLDEAIEATENKEIADMNTGVDKWGRKTLRSYPDGNPDNNLSNLPEF